MTKKKILAFGASNSSTSINRALATWAASQMEDAEVKVLDLNDYEMPIYSMDRELASGIHPLAVAFREQILDADGIVISFAEHNGAYSTAFKNIFDWISRIKGSIWNDLPMFLLATSPGARGGATALDIAMNKFKFMNTNTLVGYSLPSFYENFHQAQGIINQEMRKEFMIQLEQFKEALSPKVTS